MGNIIRCRESRVVLLSIVPALGGYISDSRTRRQSYTVTLVDVKKGIIERATGETIDRNSYTTGVIAKPACFTNAKNI